MELYDKALKKIVPKDVYEWMPDHPEKVAKFIKDWEDAQAGEFYYPFQCEIIDNDEEN